ncbi:hypothetical protein AXG93_2675s1450 [Marchantia polymorpha subsp. ruderalis]|uniref:Uncharacterized protein n=1 Tax=Marchantia polymorpha subsp. ruderalis TaxID=1480154 RepID=A0A176VQZ1_MARPO|nr:hypothetical protein AXG93_2675s1450 [Marchantia polymorpha subsp. ruderalis]
MRAQMKQDGAVEVQQGQSRVMAVVTGTLERVGRWVPTVDAVITFVQSLVVGSKELISVQTDGFIDVFGGSLCRGTAIQLQLRSARSGVASALQQERGTDKATFPFVPISIRVGMSGQSCAISRC